MSLGLLGLLLLAQAPTSAFDDGAIAGQVCEDIDGDGACGAQDPPLAGVTVFLETGLESRTDSAGRFHLAAVPGRTPDTFGGGRLLPGRHRVKVDGRRLASGATVTPDGATVEVPMGGLVFVSFAVRRADAGAAAVRQGDALPRVRVVKGALSVQLSYAVAADSTLWVAGVQASCTAGACLHDVTIAGDQLDVPLTSVGADGRVSAAIQRVDVVRRAGSVMLVPRALTPVGQLILPLEVGAVASVRLSPSVGLSIGGVPIVVNDQGAAFPTVSAAQLEVEWRLGDVAWRDRLRLPEPHGIFAAGLLDGEAAFELGAGLRWFGRAAGVVRGRVLGLDVSGEVDLRDTDVTQAAAAPRALAMPRRLDVFARQLDPTVAAPTFADDSATVASNASENRLRLMVEKKDLGHVAIGSTRVVLGDGELGRAHRAIQGAEAVVEGRASEAVGGQLRGFVGTGQVDPLTGVGREQAHDRFVATGGSLFYLRRAPVVVGSEWIRVELRDAVTGAPLGERHLRRNQDYTLEPVSGRLLLALPLSFHAAASVLATDSLTRGATAELVVDYEALVSGASEGAVGGGVARGHLGPVEARASAMVDGAWTLLSGRADARLGRIRLSAEVASTRGMLAVHGFSRDGGLSFLSSTAAGPGAGLGLLVRARGAGLFNEGFFDVAYRNRSPGYVDAQSVGALEQFSLRAEQPLGAFSVSAIADLRGGVDPRRPYDGALIRSRLLGGGVGYRQGRFSARLEVREAQLEADGQRGNRLAAGAALRVQVTDWLTVGAGHRQGLSQTGAGPAAFNDTFTQAQVDVTVNKAQVGLRGGWGPVLGPQVWGVGQWAHGETTWYGVQSLDVDAPSVGERRTTTGARTALDASRNVFAEDVMSHDVDGLRLSRAVGLTQSLLPGLVVSGRYERGVRMLLDVAPDLERDAAGASVSWELGRARLFASGEARRETGPESARPQRLQWWAAAGGEVRLSNDLVASGRVTTGHSQLGNPQADGPVLTRFLEGFAAVAWRPAWGAVIARYTATLTRPPPAQGGVERQLQVVSLLPSVKLGDRFVLSGGGHLGWLPGGAIVSASLRPSVRIVSSLELAAEVARRSSAPDAGELWAVRGEVGYRFDARFLLAGGYTFLGFSGTGIDDGAQVRRDRLYLRGEAAF